MSNSKFPYQEAVELRQRCCDTAAALLPLLESFKKDLFAFYDAMRWTGIDCTEEEYEKLFANFIYELEQCVNVEYSINILLEFLPLLAKQATSTLEGEINHEK